MSAFTQRLLHRKLGLVAMVVLVAALAGGITAGAVLGSGSGSPAAAPEAAIISVTPAITFLAAPPASVMPGALDTTGETFAFDEQQGVVLAAPLTVDLLGAPGAFVSGLPVPPTGDIPTGTVVNSHFVHFEPQGLNSSFGTMTFDGDILGVIFTPAGLDATDTSLGNPGTTYPTGNAARGPEFDDEDSFTISGDQRTLEVDWGFPGEDPDQLRVITQAESTQPPPGTGDGPDPLPRMPSFQQQLDILSGDTVPPELAHSAIGQLPGMLLGPPVVLPTSGGQVTMETWMETQRFSKRTALDLQDAINALTDVKMGAQQRPRRQGPRQPGQRAPGGYPQRHPGLEAPGDGCRPRRDHPSPPQVRQTEDRGSLLAPGTHEVRPVPH